MNPKLSIEMKESIIKLLPERVIFNPGSENNELKKELEQNRIKCLNSCTLVMIESDVY